MKSIATLILNRNLPKVTDKLYMSIKKNEGHLTDIFVIEAGSSKNNLSKYTTWYANSKSVKRNGLRFPRGMNYGLYNLWKENLFHKYDAFFLITNDTVIKDKKTLLKLYRIIKNNEKIGILAPTSKNWGENRLIGRNSFKFSWYIHNHAYFLNKEFLIKIINTDGGYQNFLFDGSNFRGYGLESELIAKAYANNFAAAITNKVFVEENEDYLLKYDDLIKTDSYSKNLNLYYKEGLKWMKKKYGFNNKWLLQNYVKLFYDDFFVNFPKYKKYKI
jgi:GT2 family glycosyltransferase